MKLRDLVYRVGRKRASKRKDIERLQERFEDASSQPFGLFILNDAITSSADTVDLVAVHGLGGHRTRTWQHADTKAYWLRDFVPGDIKNARVMVYGYNSAVAFSKSTAGVEEFARDLLARLNMVRQDGNRPIIFICHSMGGLVVKKALVIAHERSTMYGTITDATVGVVFLATPHRGSSFAGPAEFASILLRAAQLGTGTNTKLVTSLRQNAEFLWDISCQFVERASGIYTRTFYETEPLPFMSSLIVDKNSAVLHHPNEIAVPMLNTNHRTICQFPHRDCPNYALLKAALQDLYSMASSRNAEPNENDDAATNIIQQFHKSTYEEYRASVKIPIDDTCIWFLHEPTYMSWLQSPSSSLLWISGDPGCGKTTLAAFLVDSISQHLSEDKDAIAICFFFDGNIATQDDGTALLLALIHQLLKADPALAPLAAKHLNLNNPQFGLSLHNLCEIFRLVISSPERKHCRVACVVDALDECETASLTKTMTFLSSIVSCNSTTNTKDGWFKLAVTSRYTQPIDDLFRAFPPHHRIGLADHAAHIARDIATFIRARCAHVQTITRCSDVMRRTVEKQLIARSDNTFLWIHLVLDLLETATDATPESFEATLRSVPDKLDGLYDSILRRSAAPEALLRVLSVIAASRRALTMEEVDVALAVGLDDAWGWQVQRRRQFDVARRLFAVCGPFICIANGTVSFIHHTAVEFLVRAPDVPRSPADGLYKYRACLDVVQINRCLAEICVVYLTLSDTASLEDYTTFGDVMDTAGEGSDDDSGHRLAETDKRQSESIKGLFDYAAKHWGAHCRLGNISSPSSCSSISTDGRGDHTLLAKAAALCDTSTSVFRAWFQLYWDTISTNPRFPDGLTPLMVASHMGLPGIMHALLTSCHTTGSGTRHELGQTLSEATAQTQLRDADSEGWTALHWAVWYGDGSNASDAAVGLLLQHLDDNDGGEPSQEQANKARTGTKTADIQDKRGLTPLHWAAADGQEGAIRLLLEAGAAVDMFDIEGMTPLSLAVENEFLGAVELLLNYGADVNASCGRDGGGNAETGSMSEEGTGSVGDWEDDMAHNRPIDECQTGLSELLDLIASGSAASRAKWIVSSRNWPEVEEKLVQANRESHSASS